jgi:hypothetical protein
LCQPVAGGGVVACEQHRRFIGQAGQLGDGRGGVTAVTGFIGSRSNLESGTWKKILERDRSSGTRFSFPSDVSFVFHGC